MTDTSIRVQRQTRQRLKAYASLHGLTQDEAICELLEEVGAPELPGQ